MWCPSDLLPPRISVEDVRGELAESKKGTLWATPASRAVAERLFGWPAHVGRSVQYLDASLIVAVGGGEALDRAKESRGHLRPPPRLIAVPSLWGSGAEASPIVVLNEEGRKRILVGEEWRPDAICWSGEFLAGIDDNLVRWACGDTWAHAIEGFLSPLASDEIRATLATLMRLMLVLPIAGDARWFEASAIACAGQSRASVGLVHGIAHVLEPLLVAVGGSDRWGHARLCAALLEPVLRFNLSQSEKPGALFRAHGLDPLELVQAAARVGEPRGTLAAPMRASWQTILRDPCTRTNSVLVRPSALDALLELCGAA